MRDPGFKEKRIRISFLPRAMEFDVWASTIQRDDKYIPDISEVFLSQENNTIPRFRREFLRNLKECRQRQNESMMSKEEEYQAEENFNELRNLEPYRIPSLEIDCSSIQTSFNATSVSI